MNRLIEAVLMSTHSICFVLEIGKVIFKYELSITGLMLYVRVNSFYSCRDVSLD